MASRSESLEQAPGGSGSKGWIPARRHHSELEYLNLQEEPESRGGSRGRGRDHHHQTGQVRNSRKLAGGSSTPATILEKVAQDATEAELNTSSLEGPPTGSNGQEEDIDSVFGGGGGAGNLSESQRCDSRRQLLLHEPASDETPVGSGKLTRNLLFAVAASAVGSSFQHGYNGGVMNAPEKLIGHFINDTYNQRRANGQVPMASQNQIDLIYATIVSVFCIGGFLGALMTSEVAKRFGRKDGLLYNNLLVLIACPLMTMAEPLSSYELLIAGRLLIGINAGLNAGLAPLYLYEIAPLNLRGTLGTVYQLVITISMFLSNLLATPQLLGSTRHWPLLFAVPLLPAAIMMTLLPHCRESPKFLLLERGRELQAQQALAWFRGTGDIQAEMDELRAERDLIKASPPVSVREMLRRPDLRRPLTISVVIMLSQQFSGINAVLFFSTSIFRSAGLQEEAAIRATLGMSLVNVLMTIVSLLLVDRIGRRTLHLTGLLGMAFNCILLAFCLGGPSASSGTMVANGGSSSVFAVVAVYLFIAMFASGPGSIPWFLIAELFPSDARALASGIAVASNWLAIFIVSICFLPLIGILHGYVFFLFAALLLLFSVFTYYKVPETKGATAEEISALFKRN